MTEDRPLLAVLIDADNVPAKYADAILKEISSIGEPGLRRVYGDWSSESLASWVKVIPKLGLVARQETANTKGKNASDIGLVIDAMDILHSSKFDGFVIVSSDSDFTALANRLREDGLKVIGIGEAKTPQSVRSVCNQFILIENLTGQMPKAVVKPAKQDTKHPALTYFLEAMEEIDSESGWYLLSGIGSQINAAHPDFDPRSFGTRNKKLSSLVELIPDLDTMTEGTHLFIRLKS